MTRWLFVLLLMCGTAWAQENAVDRARTLARAGQHREAIRLLEQHIAAAPNDVDALTLYGTVLSWEHDFERARRVLTTVLLLDPSNRDAREALARVETWSRSPRAEGRGPSAEATVGGTYDNFEESDAWREAELAIKKVWAPRHPEPAQRGEGSPPPRSFASLRMTWPAAAVLRLAHATRFDLDDDQVELEAYPRFGAETYAYLSGGYSPHARLYPRSRFGAELYQAFGSGFEGSAGYRRLNFTDAANVYTASLSKYAGNWLFTVRGYRSGGADSIQGLVRRYLRVEGDYAGVRLGKGSTRDDIRSVTDIEALDSIDGALEARLTLRGAWFMQGRIGAGRRPRHAGGTLLLGRRF